jgi:hypothetical protein
MSTVDGVGSSRFASHSASLPIANAAVCPLNANANPMGGWDSGKKRKADHADMLQVVLNGKNKLSLISVLFSLSLSLSLLLPRVFNLINCDCLIISFFSLFPPSQCLRSP